MRATSESITESKIFESSSGVGMRPSGSSSEIVRTMPSKTTSYLTCPPSASKVGAETTLPGSSRNWDWTESARFASCVVPHTRTVRARRSFPSHAINSWFLAAGWAQGSKWGDWASTGSHDPRSREQSVVRRRLGR
jgi:hypothetical protein